jgi:hypothetical protein
MTESTLPNENNSAVGSPADAGEATAGRHKLAVLYDHYRDHALTTPLEVVGFWSAVALPFLYVPLLFTGISSQAELLTFLGLLVLNLAALLAGHGHKRD